MSKEEILTGVHSEINDYEDYHFDYDENGFADCRLSKEFETANYLIELELNVAIQIDGDDEIISRDVTVLNLEIWVKEKQLDEDEVSNQEIINQLDILKP